MNKKEAYEEIKNQIITQELRPGAVLNEKELMSAYEIGRTPLRDVFLNLQQDGLINVIPRYGTFVTSLDINDFRNAVELRTHNEILVAELVCDRISQRQLAELDKIINDSDELLNSIQDLSGEIDPEYRKQLVREFWIIEESFHNTLYKATSNTYIIDLMRKLSVNSIRFWYYTLETVEQMKQQFWDFRFFYDALAARDKEKCRQYMKDHIDLLVKQIKDRF